MKYCSKCGNELLDEAVICPKCGCMVEGTKNLNIQKTNETSETQNAKNVQIYLIAGIVLSFLAFILYAAPFVTIKFGSFSRNISGFQLLFNWGNVTGNTSEFSFAWFILPCLITLITPIGSIIGYFYGKKNSKKWSSIGTFGAAKQSTANYLILYLIFGIIFSAIPLICYLFLTKTTGYGDSPLASIGYGAVFSGVFYWIGNSCLYIRFFVLGIKDQKKSQEYVATLSHEEIEEEQKYDENMQAIKENNKKLFKKIAIIFGIILGVILIIGIIVFVIITIDYLNTVNSIFKK